MRTTVQSLVTLFWSPLKPQRCKTKNEHKHREAFTPATTGADTTADTHNEEPPAQRVPSSCWPLGAVPRELLPRSGGRCPHSPAVVPHGPVPHRGPPRGRGAGSLCCPAACSVRTRSRRRLSPPGTFWKRRRTRRGRQGALVGR